jgi:hypothetical protein
VIKSGALPTRVKEVETKMEAVRQFYEKAPATITVPLELRDQSVEIIILSLAQTVTMPAANGEPRDANGWPLGFFEATAGCQTSDLLTREPQGAYEMREELA